jgi:hypothetical protein
MRAVRMLLPSSVIRDDSLHKQVHWRLKEMVCFGSNFKSKRVGMLFTGRVLA